MRYLAAAILPLFFISWGLGAGSYGYSELFTMLSGGDVSIAARTVLLDIRLPRLLAAFLVGGMLAASGCATQNLFRNDLASPHVLGVVNSAALGAVVGFFIGEYFVAPLSIVFGLASLLLLFIPGKLRGWDATVLILAGIAVNAFSSALTSGALYLADERLSSLVFWLLGGFWRITWNDIKLLIPVAFAGWIILYMLSPEMDMLLLGDRASNLAGVPLKIIKPLTMVTVAGLTAVAVSCCGVIGFVGLAVPHIVRIFTGASFKKLLPGSILTGGVLLVAADIPARVAAAPHEIPVGVLMALGGGPFFFYLLIADRRRSHD